MSRGWPCGVINNSIELCQQGLVVMGQSSCSPYGKLASYKGCVVVRIEAQQNLDNTVFFCDYLPVAQERSSSAESSYMLRACSLVVSYSLDYFGYHLHSSHSRGTTCIVSSSAHRGHLQRLLDLDLGPDLNFDRLYQQVGISSERLRRISMRGWKILKAEILAVQENMGFDPGGEILAKL
eukprot:1185822-Prorocentrum_minimum.AAC.1